MLLVADANDELAQDPTGSAASENRSASALAAVGGMSQ